MPLTPEALALLQCPRGCADPLARQGDACACAGCGARYPLRGTHRDIVDFVPELGRSRGRAQRAMESALLARIYEDHWRPWFTSLASELDYAAEEAWLSQAQVGAPDGPALDLACGTGRYARWLSRRRPDSAVVGVDLSLPMLEQAAARARVEGASNLALVRASAQRLPLRAGSFAALNCFGALHLFPEPAQALAELGRVARPGAVLTCLTARRPDRGAARLVHRSFSRLSSFAFFDEASLREQLGAAGFEGYAPRHAGAALLFRAARR